jgi:hypothetical protein
MGLFDEDHKTVKENYVRVLDILERLYEKSDQGWFEVLQFLLKSSIESITTYTCNNGIIPSVQTCNEVPIENVYEDTCSDGSLKEALCAFITNNCEHLDGDYLENRIIAEIKFKELFEKYVWMKNDIQQLGEFKKHHIIEIIEKGTPLKTKGKTLKHCQGIYDDTNPYEELIFCIEHFSVRFGIPLAKVAKILKEKNFYLHTKVHIRIDDMEFIQLNKNNSDKSILFVLNFLDDSKFNSTDLGYNTDYYHLNHILIDEDDLLYFEPLRDLIVDMKIGNAVYENIRYGDINLNKLPIAEKYAYQEDKKTFDELWVKLKQTQISQESDIESNNTNMGYYHPSLDPNHPQHAPELLLATQVWQAKYLNNEYSHHKHTPAITNILKQRGVTEVNRVKRICAITNPKK